MASAIVSLIFDKEKWSVREAKEWLKEHGFKTELTDITDRYLRFRQDDPRFYERFATKDFGKGIKAIFGFIGERNPMEVSMKKFTITFKLKVKPATLEDKKEVIESLEEIFPRKMIKVNDEIELNAKIICDTFEEFCNYINKIDNLVVDLNKIPFIRFEFKQKLNPPPSPPITTETKKGWRKRAPLTISERRELLEKYGRRAFLLPDELKFPVVDKKGRYDCMGILSAFRRARQYGYDDVAEKALRLAKRIGCEWAKRWERENGWIKNPDDIETIGEHIVAGMDVE